MQRSFMYRDMAHDRRRRGVVAPDSTLDQVMHLVPDHRRPSPDGPEMTRQSGIAVAPRSAC